MAENLKFKGEEIKENRATDAFKDAIKNLKEEIKTEVTGETEKTTIKENKVDEETKAGVDKTSEIENTSSELNDIKIDVVKKFLEQNQDKDRSYRVDNGSKSGLTGQIVTAVQIALKDFGFNPGTIDGRVGPKTNGALNAFKVAAKIEEDNIGKKIVAEILANIGAPEGAKIIHTGETPRLVNSKGGNNVINNDNEEKDENNETDSVKSRKMIVIKGNDALSQIEGELKREGNSVKVMMFNGKQYGFFNNGKAGIYESESQTYTNVQKSEDLVKNLKKRKSGETEVEINKEEVEVSKEVSKEEFNDNIYLKIFKNISKIDLNKEFNGNKDLLEYIKNNTISISKENPYFIINKKNKSGNEFEIGRINIRTKIEKGQFQNTEYINKVKEIIEEKYREDKLINIIQKKNYTLDSLGFSKEEQKNLSIQTYMEKIDNGVFKLNKTKINKKDNTYLDLELITNSGSNVFRETKVDNFTTTKGSFDFDEEKTKKWLKRNIKSLAESENPLT